MLPLRWSAWLSRLLHLWQVWLQGWWSLMIPWSPHSAPLHENSGTSVSWSLLLTWWVTLLLPCSCSWYSLLCSTLIQRSSLLCMSQSTIINNLNWLINHWLTYLLVWLGWRSVAGVPGHSLSFCLPIKLVIFNFLREGSIKYELDTRVVFGRLYQHS